MTTSKADAETPQLAQPPPAGSTWYARGWAYLLVAAVASIISLWYLGQCTLEEHECYVACVGATMADPDQWLDPQLNTGQLPPNTTLNHWTVPVFNGQPRLVKTPLAYWCVAGLAKMGVHLDTTTARLPSAFAAILLSLVTLALGRKMFHPRVALIGALILTTSIGYIDWGRSGRPEMLLCLFMAVAMYCFYVAINSGRWTRHLWLPAGWAAMGVASLAKEVVPLFLIPPLLIYLAWQESQLDDRLRPQSYRTLRITLVAMIVGVILYSVMLSARPLQWWHTLGDHELIGNMLTAGVLVGGAPIVYFFKVHGFRRVPWRFASISFVILFLGLPLLLIKLNQGWFVEHWQALFVCQVALYILVTLLAHFRFSRGSSTDRRMSLLIILFVPCVALMLSTFAVWMLYVQGLFPNIESVLNTQVTNRAAGMGRWQDTKFPAFYVFSLLGLISPWVVLAPGALAVTLMDRFRRDAKGLVFLLLWVVVIVLLFSCSVGKRWHYILPTLPAMCLLLGYCLDDLFFRHRWLNEKMASLFANGHAIAALVAAVLLGAAALSWHVWPPATLRLAAKLRLDVSNPELPSQFLHLFCVAVAAAVPLLLGAWAYSRKKPAAAVTMLVVGVALSLLTYMTRLDLWDSTRDLRDIAVLAKQEVANCNGRIAAWEKPNGKIVFYFGKNIPAANAVAQKLVARFGQDEGTRRWNLWLHDQSQPIRMLARLGGEDDVKELHRYGFEAVSPVPKKFKEKVPVIFKLTAMGEATQPTLDAPTDRE